MHIPFIQTFSHIVDYHDDPTLVFSSLCRNKKNTLLLESADIGNKKNLKSLLLINSAVKITCYGQSVFFHALNQNGLAVLQALDAVLPEAAKCERPSHDVLQADFAPAAADLDEDSKLQAHSVFDGLRSLLKAYRHSETPIVVGGLFSYDLVANFMPIDGVDWQEDALSCPDYCFYLADQLLVIDHETQRNTLQYFCFDAALYQDVQEDIIRIKAQLENIAPTLPIKKAATEVTVNLEDTAFKKIIEDLKHHIYSGDVFQIVPSRRFSLPCPNALASYRQLKRNNPSPYMFFMQDDDFFLFGASPESALKYDSLSNQVEIYPIAGSRPRGFNANGEIDNELDARLELEMRLDKKELAEHLMLVDLARNDVARVSRSGTRRVADLMQVDRYSHIMHLVSRVVGELRPELDALHAYQACMNMGTLTGAPKIRAMQLIYQFEKQKRHSYGGAIGYLTSEGDMDTCIVIRSAFVQNDVAYIQAGCGEVLDSDAQMEADETRHKARAVIHAIVQTNERGQ